jgi:DNA-binding transcriptional LysR family regulator
MNETDLTRIDLNLLVLFEAVYRERHVGSAAKRMHVSSSAVSHGLGRLRELFDDPLFLRNPKGVVPSARAEALAQPIAEALSRIRQVMGSIESFDAERSTRRFSIGASDATLAVLLPRLLQSLRREGPRIDLRIRNLLPMSGLGELEDGSLDVSILPLDDVPARFATRVLAEEEFVIAARVGHPFLRAPTLRRYCELSHVLVSITGESVGYIDGVLAEKGVSRRVALTVPTFLLALAAVSGTDLVSAVPNSLIAEQGGRFGLASVRAPLPLRRWKMLAIVPEVALADPGIAWLLGAIERAAAAERKRRTPASTRS